MCFLNQKIAILQTPGSQPYKSILKSDSSSLEKFPRGRQKKSPHTELGFEVDGEATFSDEDGSDSENRSKSLSGRSKFLGSASAYSEAAEKRRKLEMEKRKIPLEIDPKGTPPPIKMSRPSFKALVEIILSASIDELILHPDFV